MNTKYTFLSLFFGLAVLFALLLQSGHSFSHFEKELAEKQCHHKLGKNKTELTHAHHKNDHCFVCEFAFSSSIQSNFFVFNFKKVTFPNFYSFFYSKEITHSFRGSLFALRAPPYVV